MHTITPAEINPVQLQAILQSAIAPRPIALASTVDQDGNPNLSPFSFFNIFSSNPPILVFSPARRVRNNTTKHTLENCIETREVVINVVNKSIVQQASLSSTEYPDGVNEFDKAGFTMVPSENIRPFRVKESPVQMECKISDIISLGREGGAGNLIICEIVKIHIDPMVMNDQGGIDQKKIDLVARLGANWYSSTSDSLFEIPKPLTTMGIGVDNIPTIIKSNPIFNGNDLGLLGNVEKIPNQEEICIFVEASEDDKTLLINNNEEEILNKVKHYLQLQDATKAWCLLSKIYNLDA